MKKKTIKNRCEKNVAKKSARAQQKSTRAQHGTFAGVPGGHTIQQDRI